ncbi:MAG: 2-C-methyl-D-erythritol 4-phosphate cytidylyltransferase [Acidobacteria bacterium 13_1_20CM_2_55_15]|nr:MAG: 2-C-methyl-D-erythritol 4-phosphate cytidylyltransferase [Acidobacteria bacterium 13_1_40CM_56_16]OLD15691.1 MAG: 2-C-methyl-D-erythritol 4-phosphate cytidylyltransferase [Acidobacteria bacterium 13_1_40CM_3_56_11]OLE88326.1 MAG: 2-C-methyl-D-erythritol 4-phosphate cytidylyltransferase [Acidobacteria bacterium 13_1_20CM_2_55_15]PYR71785.1 MAG: 2-C-methyl-D-erythritol 4-phosphate cytidylyltransferase [Acidobacteriota bacterium]PYR92073.1 MAG: 2-C-methyl-D-erythritol 4-phosphate cytidylyl
MKVGAIIAAAGFGRRMKADRPKQLLALNGIPIIIHTIRKFDISRVIDYIIVTAPRESVIEVSELVKSAEFQKPVIVVQGGERRQDSVASGLNHLQPGTDIVAVHDGVRPFVSTDDIENAVRQAERTGAAVLAVPIVDTVKQVEKDVIDSTLTREHLVLAQTPQVFRTEILKQAFDRATKDEYYGTDESSLVERLGHPVAIVRGSERNIKITRPSDLSLARAFLEEERAEAKARQ